MRRNKERVLTPYELGVQDILRGLLVKKEAELTVFEKWFVDIWAREPDVFWPVMEEFFLKAAKENVSETPSELPGE